MPKTKHLMVYRYEYWDEAQNLMRTSETYATLDAILKGGGIPLLYTGKVVPHVAIFHELLPALADAGPPPAGQFAADRPGGGI